MADNALQTVQKLLQDLIAPDVRETKVRVESLEKHVDSIEKRMDEQFELSRRQTDAQFDSLRREMEAGFRTLMAMIGEMKAHSEAISARDVAAVRERVAVLEALQQRPQ